MVFLFSTTVETDPSSVEELVEVPEPFELLDEQPVAPEQPNGESVPQTTQEHPAITVLQRPTNSINLMVLDVASAMQPIEVLTRHLAAAGELELMASPRAQSLIRGRSKSLQAKSSPASLLLDALLMPLNLGWRQTEEQIQIFSLDEVSEEESKQFWIAAADRTLRRFNLAFPGDYRGESALLSRANFKFLQGDTESAANHYQELVNHVR